jgi:hypothetical protein
MIILHPVYKTLLVPAMQSSVDAGVSKSLRVVFRNKD